MIGLGRPVKVGEPEDLLEHIRTIFGAKIMCGLWRSPNPQSYIDDWGFFCSIAQMNALQDATRSQDPRQSSNAPTGMRKRKGVRFPCCRATVMETKADNATALTGAGRPASRMS